MLTIAQRNPESEFSRDEWLKIGGGKNRRKISRHRRRHQPTAAIMMTRNAGDPSTRLISLQPAQ